MSTREEKIQLAAEVDATGARKGLAELEVAHGMAAVFHHDRLALIALHIGERLRENPRIMAESVGR